MQAPAPLFRNLAHLHGAGVPWPEAVTSATGGDPSWRTVAADLARGSSVAAAFEPRVDALDAALLRAGETSGTLQSALEQIAASHEAEARRRTERRTRAAYPVVLAHLGALLLPLPDLLAPTPRLGAALAWMALVLVPLHLVLAILRRAARRARPPRDPIAKPPPPLLPWGPFASLVEEADARALEALARLHDAGVPADETTRLAARAGWGGRAAVDLHEARARVLCGEDLAGAWRTVPRDLATRLSAAERAGELSREARAAAQDLRFRADARSQRTTALLPLVLMLLVGGAVAWRVIAFWTTYYGRF